MFYNIIWCSYLFMVEIVIPNLRWLWHLFYVSNSFNHRYPILELFSTICFLGVAGMCSKTTVAPLDRIKILLQAHSTHYKHLGVFSGLRHIIRKESFFALYKGNGAQMVRIFPYAAIQFTSFEFYKRVNLNLFIFVKFIHPNEIK